ncbi:thioredoxin domain-containing protein [Myxococcota bacterium]|nr:thioredoxin domain-containing protein [Myxococcota bacterium]
MVSNSTRGSLQWTVALLLGCLMGCQSGSQSAKRSDTEPGADQGVAVVNGKTLTQGELDDWIREDLFNQETRGRNPSQLYELRSRSLEDMIDERVISEASAKQNLSADELFESEVEELGGVDEAEVVAFYEANKSQMGGATFEEIAPRIRLFLQSRLSGEVIEKLREKAGVRILLEPVRINVAAEGPSKGPEGASVTIIEFSDFQCPFCQRAIPVLDAVLARYPDEVRLVYRHLPLPNHSRARPAAEASVCADAQGEFWAYHDLVFENNRQLTDADLLQFAVDLELDMDAFNACLVAPETREAVTRDQEAARNAGISGTPAFVIDGRLISGARPEEEFVRIIDAALAAPPDEG